MSSEFLYADDLSFNKPGVKPERQGKIEKGFKRFLIIAGIVLGAELVWLFIVSPCIPLSTKEVRGFAGFDGEEVLRYAGIGEEASFFSVNAKETEKLLSLYPAVESAKVLKRFPDRISIFLEPRRAVAVSLTPVRGRMLPVFFDKYGVIFKIGYDYETSEIMPLKLPLVSGLVFENPVPGNKLPPTLGPLLSEFARLEETAPELLDTISEIRIRSRAYNGFDLLLYPLHYPVRVLLGDNFTEETLRYMLLMLDVLQTRGPMPAEIDFRSGVGSYKVKEARSGE